MYVKFSRPDNAFTVYLDGDPVTAYHGDTVAAVLLRQPDIQGRSTPISGAPRTAFCMMGLCFDCLITIDDRASQQGCQVLACEGMRINRQHGAREVRS